MGTGFNLFSSAGVIACSGGSGCMYWGGVGAQVFVALDLFFSRGRERV